jgi:hypothetical protein
VEAALQAECNALLRKGSMINLDAMMVVMVEDGFSSMKWTISSTDLSFWMRLQTFLDGSIFPSPNHGTRCSPIGDMLAVLEPS